MPIEWIDDARQLHLHNGQLSLVLRVLESGHLGQLHLGAPLAPGRDYRHLGRGGFPGFDNRVASPDRFALPTWGSGDFRQPAVAVRHADGSNVLALEVAGHRIVAGKPAIDPLPATYVEDDAEADYRRDHARRPAQRRRGRAAAHDLARPAGHHPLHGHPQRRPHTRRRDHRDVRQRRPARQRVDDDPAVRRVGA